MIKAAFGIPVTSPSGSSAPRSTLRGVALGRSLHVQPFVQLFASVVKGNKIAFEMSLFDGPVKEKQQQIWRWIAFGIYYPRPKHSASACIY